MNIFATPALDIIIFLGRHPRESYYVRELAKILAISTGAASERLRELAEAGLVTSEQRGRTLLFRADLSHPLVREAKIFMSLIELAPLISDRGGSAGRIILFGSCATGEDAAESDIDLYIESTDRSAAADLIRRREQEISRRISPVIVTPAEAAQLRTRDRPLFDRIRAGKVLAGEPL